MSADRTEDDPDSAGALFDMYSYLAEQIALPLPLIRSAQSSLSDAFRPVSYVVNDFATPDDPIERSRSRIINQANNDFLDLLFEVMCGRGRPALRTARSIFEHLVNHRWISRDVAEAHRYWDHRAIDDLLEFELTAPREEDFTGAARKQARHMRKKMGRGLQHAADAEIRRHGSSFKRSWSKASLRQRAEACGLHEEYEMYRLLSTVIHGSAGGDLGQRADLFGESVVRLGPSVGACPLALRKGLDYYQAIIRDLDEALGSGVTDRLKGLLRDIEAVTADHAELCAQVDAQIWPDEPPQVRTYLRVGVDGRREWFICDTEANTVTAADPWKPDAGQLEMVNSLVMKAELANPGRTVPMVIGVAGIHALPRRGAHPRPPEEVFENLETTDGRWIQVREPVTDPGFYRHS